jgi:hypothetical protein
VRALSVVGVTNAGLCEGMGLMRLMGPMGQTHKSHVSHRSHPVAGSSGQCDPRGAYAQRPLEDEYEPIIPLILLQNRYRFANLTPARKIPRIGEAGALVRFHRLDKAVLTFQENATPIGPLLQRQTIPLRPQTGKTLNKCVFRTLQKASYG